MWSTRWHTRGGKQSRLKIFGRPSSAGRRSYANRCRQRWCVLLSGEYKNYYFFLFLHVNRASYFCTVTVFGTRFRIEPGSFVSPTVHQGVRVCCFHSTASVRITDGKRDVFGKFEKKKTKSCSVNSKRDRCYSLVVFE